MSTAQEKLQALSDEFQKLQSDLQAHVQARQKLEAQQQENKGVQKQFNDLDESSNIYKLVGPVLLKQERIEAVQTVDGRLNYIDGEIKRLDGLISDAQSQAEKKKTEIYQLQVTQQAASSPTVQAAS